MGYNEHDRSELELRFETLVRETYGKSVNELFTPQKRVDINGKTYRIDYVPKSNPSVAIELDGRVKFDDFGESLSQFANRQNDLVQAGYKPVRLTWKDVTENQGKKALERLESIARLTTHLQEAPGASPSFCKEYGEIFAGKPILEQFKQIPNFTLKRTSIYSLSSEEIEAIFAEIRQSAISQSQQARIFHDVRQAKREQNDAVWPGKPIELFVIPDETRSRLSLVQSKLPGLEFGGQCIYTFSGEALKTARICITESHLLESEKEIREYLLVKNWEKRQKIKSFERFEPVIELSPVLNKGALGPQLESSPMSRSYGL